MKLLGFIGVGTMGRPMAVRLLESGFRLVVCDKSGEAVESLSPLGASAVKTPADLASTPGLEAIISMLPSPAAVREAYSGEQGILSVGPGRLQPHLLIDSSTIDPITAREVAAAVESTPLHPDSTAAHKGQTHALMLDAPVSGGGAAAVSATLTFMVGGSEGGLAAAMPFLSSMGRRIIHCGPHGTGQAAKVCNNLAMAIGMTGVAEGLSLGRRLGLDPVLLSQIFSSSSARSWSCDTYNPCPGVLEGVPSSRGYKPGFRAGLMCKDLQLALHTAQNCGAPLPMTEAAKALYDRVDPALDFSAIYQDVYEAGKQTEVF